MQEEGTTPEGFPVDGTGKVETKDLGMGGPGNQAYGTFRFL